MRVPGEARLRRLHTASRSSAVRARRAPSGRARLCRLGARVGARLPGRSRVSRSHSVLVVVSGDEQRGHGADRAAGVGDVRPPGRV
jgi:hypothetical protein